MIKQILLIILLSLAAIFFHSELSRVLDGLIYAHNFIDKSLGFIFSKDRVGRLIQDMISLLLIPLLGGLIIAALYWMLKRSKLPNAMGVVWALWLVLVIAMLATSTPSSSVAATAKESEAITAK